MDKDKLQKGMGENSQVAEWMEVMGDAPERHEGALEGVEMSEIVGAFERNLETDGQNETCEIVEVSPEITPFYLLKERRGEDGGKSKTAHYFCPGFLGPSDEYFDELADKMEGDVYAIDRTGDFNMKHGLNGVLASARETGYEEVEILAISVAAGGMGEALEEYEPEEGDPRISLIYIDPYDVNNFALGAATKNSLAAKSERGLVKVLGQIALLAAALPASRKVLEVGGPIEKPSSIRYVLQQFAALAKHAVIKEDGTVLAQEYLTGVIHTGDKTHDAKNRDVFMDVKEMDEAYDRNGVSHIQKGGEHGVISTIGQEGDLSGPTAAEAYEELRKGRHG